jgi:hypothetical protein
VEPPPQSLKWSSPPLSPDAVAQNLQHAQSIPETVVQTTCTILQFLASFLRNSINKPVFNSVGEISALLAAADDTIADLALQTLSSLSLPPLLSRQHTQEVNQHSSALHLAPPQTGVHSRLMELARGWGTKGTDLSLVDCVSADDSIHGQGSLPQYPGQFIYEFYPQSQSANNCVTQSSHGTDGRIISIQLSEVEIDSSSILEESSRVFQDFTPNLDDLKQVEKRRKMGSHGNDKDPCRNPSFLMIDFSLF